MLTGFSESLISLQGATMLDFIIQGGAILWFIMGLAVVAGAIIIERLIFFRKIWADEEKLYLRIRASIKEGHYNEAMAICDQQLCPLSTVMKVAIENREYSESIQREILKDAVAQQAPRLERYLSSLGTITNIAPLLGLLGTVTGTMKAFGVLGKFGAVSDPAALANGVSEALITTVGGILVAVPATIFYNYLTSRVNVIITNLETQVNTVILMLNSAADRERR